MIKTKSEAPTYLTSVSNGGHRLMSDTVEDYGGGNAGFRPHELLEAAFASCLNIWLRMCADKQDIPLRHVEVEVSLKRDASGTITFEYRVHFAGPLLEIHRNHLLDAAEHRPVRQTLLKRLEFHRNEHTAVSEWHWSI